MAMVKGTEYATIDVVLVTVKPYDEEANEIGFETANQVQIAPAIETTEKTPLIVKGKLIAQKPQKSTITGNTITLTDNVFNADLVKLLQGGKIKYDTIDTTKVIGYTPPASDSGEEGELFKLVTYSAIYNAAGVIEGYERIEYPNCKGQPVAFGAQDGTFRAPEYTINSAPDNGQPPYDLDIVTELPKFTANTAGA